MITDDLKVLVFWNCVRPITSPFDGGGGFDFGCHRHPRQVAESVTPKALTTRHPVLNVRIKVLSWVGYGEGPGFPLHR